MVFTVPNAITVARLLGVPLFIYLMLGPQHDLAALLVLAVGGSTDWFDGWAARRLGQVSRLGTLLDPTVDRLYIVATLLVFTLREIVPWWFAGALLARELVLLAALALLRRAGYGPLPVHYLGKTATFILLAAFPTLLFAVAVPAASDWAYPVGWALGWWGLVLYWAAAVLYLTQAGQLLRRQPRVP
ncbi:MAG TPA: CDP-alcohol phosphatidyltransferase family protein [Natronosporangium sp.]